MVNASVRAISTALPATAMDQRQIWDDWFAARYERRGAARLWASAGVETRYTVADPRVEDVSGWGTAARMERYMLEALPLARRAVERALRAAAMTPGDVDLLTVVSCTGYSAPGIDILLARDLCMSRSLQRLVVGHVGCHAALPALAITADAVAARGLTGVVVCVELPSLHVQPPGDDSAQLVVHSLFGDAAAAVVLTPAGAGLQLVDTIAATDIDHHDDMRWDITDVGFRMVLSHRVPRVLARHLAPSVDALLQRNGHTRDDVRGWAIHPGGPRILDVCADELGLDDAALEPSRATLRDHGNCSSATVLLALRELTSARRALEPGDPVVMIGFGPGLTLYATLLRQQ